MKVRLAAVAALVVALGASLLAATPASAEEPIAPAGAIDTVSVYYHESVAAPGLHITGWAADLNDWGVNGNSGASIEFTAAAPGGSPVTIGWAENGYFGWPTRPAVQSSYGIGPRQGFDVTLTPLPMKGPLNICAKLWNIYAYPANAVFSCVNVNVPSVRPSVASLTGSLTGPGPWTGTVGSPISVSLSAPTGGTNTYAWNSWNPVTPYSMWPTTIPGATSSTYTPKLGDTGHYLRAIVTSRLPSVTIEQETDYAVPYLPLPGSWTRVAAGDRYATAVAVSQSAFPDATAGVPVAYIASGVTFPDALSAGAAAAEKHGTLLLTHPGSLDAVVATELGRLHPERIIVVGGPAAISDTVVGQLQALPFAPAVQRIGGADRYAVSRAVVEDAFGTSVPDLYLVTGNAFPDALAAAAAGAMTHRPVLLVDGWMSRVDDATAVALARWGTTHVTVVGGTGSVSDAVVSGLGTAVDRVAGTDRYGTAAQLALTLPRTGSTYMASGMNFPDALTAAVLAGVHPAPLLLTNGWCAPVSSLSAMQTTGTSSLVAIGGDAVLNSNGWSIAC